MAKRLRIRRGNYADLPTLSAGELGFAEDTANLYIGQTSGTNKLLATLDISSLSEIDAIASTDKIPVYDVSTSTNKFVEAGDLISSTLRYTARINVGYDQDYVITRVTGVNTLSTATLSMVSATEIRVASASLTTTNSLATFSGYCVANGFSFIVTDITYATGYVSIRFADFNNEAITPEMYGDNFIFNILIEVYP